MTYPLPRIRMMTLLVGLCWTSLRGRSCSEAVAASWSTRPYTEATVVAWTNGEDVVWTIV